MRSWVDTIFTPQGALDTFLFQKQTKSVILLIKLTPHLPHKVPSHSFNSDTQNVNTKDILGGHHIHPSSCPCYLSLVVLITVTQRNLHMSNNTMDISSFGTNSSTQNFFLVMMIFYVVTVIAPITEVSWQT